MKLDTENDNVFFVEMTVNQIRNEDETAIQKVYEALDEAQAKVFGGERAATYVVIEVING